MLRLPSSTGRSLQARALSGLLSTESNMDQFVRSQNVARYRRLLERVTEESDRQTIIKLLAEAQHKQKVASDPVW